MTAAASLIRNLFSVILLDMKWSTYGHRFLLFNILLKRFNFPPKGAERPFQIEWAAMHVNHTGRGRRSLVKRSIGQVRNRKANHILLMCGIR